MLLEVSNAISLCYIATEAMFSGKTYSDLLRPALMLAGTNLLLLILETFDFFWILPEIQHWLYILGETIPLMFLLSVPTALSVMFCKCYLSWAKQALPWALVYASPTLPLLLITMTRLRENIALDSVLRLDLIMASFLVFCYWELRLQLSQLSFFRELSCAFVIVVVCFPLLAIAIALLMLLVANLFDSIGLDSQILSSPIYYGVFYGPFSAIYFLMKRKARKLRLLLPQ